MRKIDERVTTRIFQSYIHKHCETVPLEELCEAFNLSIKDDGDVLFELLAEHLWYSDKPKAFSNKFAWNVDAAGFQLISDYAHAKQECLSTFQNYYKAGYIKSKKAEKEKK